MNENLESSIFSTQRTVFEFSRAALIEGWWWWALLVAGFGLLLFGCARFYRRDTVELSRSVSVTLIFLRLATLVALLFFFLDFQRRTQREITRPSEVVVLVDTSQSMSLAESDRLGSPSRSERVATLLSENALVEQLAEEHRVSVYGFGDSAEPSLLESRSVAGEVLLAENLETPDSTVSEESGSAYSPIALIGMAFLLIAGALSVASFLVGGLSRNASDSKAAPPERLGWLLGVTAICLFVGSSCAAALTAP